MPLHTTDGDEKCVLSEVVDLLKANDTEWSVTHCSWWRGYDTLFYGTGMTSCLGDEGT
ncbi:hypothetical protein OH492_20485 [Vibrio chagasii]|nr:hypothetical protein [Vibrio chagasii]